MLIAMTYTSIIGPVRNRAIPIGMSQFMPRHQVYEAHSLSIVHCL